MGMSKTYTRKVHKGEIQKMKNAEEKAKQEELEKEHLEAQSWSDGTKISVTEIRKQKELEKIEHKKKLQELYEKEMNEE